MLFLGIDLGTSASKAVLIDDRGGVLATGSSDHPIARPHPGWSEQHPEDWWQSACRAGREAIERAGVAPDGVRAVGLSGQMHGSVLLNERDEPVRPALLWNDQRTARECEEIEQRVGGRRAMVERVGNAALAGFTLPKLLWVRAHEPERWASVRRVMMPKDYLALRLAGVHATDVGDASGTLLFDIDRRDWHAGMLELFELDPALFPRAAESASVLSAVHADGASALGVRTGTPVVIGSGDNQTGAIGAGVVEPGLALVTIGTSGVVYAHADQPRRDLDEAAPGRLHTMCAADGSVRTPGAWSVTGCTLSAGGALAWARSVLAPGMSYSELVESAFTNAPVGSRGLLFLPHLTGERCPYPDPDARGAWIGLTARHDRDCLVRSVIEGVTCSLAMIADLARGAGAGFERCRVGGGGASSPAWRGLLAGAVGVPMSVPTTTEGPAFGAALLAGVGAGHWANAGEAARAAVRDVETTQPTPEGAQAFAPVRAAWAEVYGRVRPLGMAMGALDR